MTWSRRLAVGLAIGVGAALAAMLLGVTPLARVVELKTYDWRLRTVADPSTARRDVVIVTIDETTLRQLEPVVGRWPWPRLVHANAIDYLAHAGARAIAYDVLFLEQDRRSGFPVGDATWTGAESDQALVDSTARAGNVVHAADATYEGVGPDPSAQAPEWSGPAYALDESFEERPVVTPPFAALARASRALGHTFLALDDDGPVRRVTPFVRSRGKFIPSLAAAAVFTAEGVTPAQVSFDGDALVFGPRRLPLVAQQIPTFDGSRKLTRRALVNFHGPAVLPDGKSTTYRTYSFGRVLLSQEQILAGEPPDLSPSEFANAIVVVGVTAAGLKDVFTTPFTASGAMPGMQIHAAAIDDMLSGRYMQPASRAANTAAAFAASLPVGLPGALASVWVMLPVAAAIAIALGAASLWSSSRGAWLTITPAFLAVVIAAFTGVAYQYVVEGRAKRRVKALFSRFVSPDVYRSLMADPDRVRLGGQRREMTVLFSDIRGFTSASERGQPEAIVAQLNEYFSAMVRVLLAHRGTLDKFVGDMVMGLFGAPLDDPDHADHAVEAALAMSHELDALNERWKARGQPTLDIGIGINSGEMVAGNIGSETIMSYTVIGDAVNLGARLESLNKDYQSRILISAHTRERLKGRYNMKALGDVVVKGRTQPVTVFEVTG